MNEGGPCREEGNGYVNYDEGLILVDVTEGVLTGPALTTIDVRVPLLEDLPGLVQLLTILLDRGQNDPSIYNPTARPQR